VAYTKKKERKKEKTPVKEVFVAGTKAGCKIPLDWQTQLNYFSAAHKNAE